LLRGATTTSARDDDLVVDAPGARAGATRAAANDATRLATPRAFVIGLARGTFASTIPLMPLTRARKS
jgi:uncharacterized protein (DUF2062 family)